MHDGAGAHTRGRGGATSGWRLPKGGWRRNHGTDRGGVKNPTKGLRKSRSLGKQAETYWGGRYRGESRNIWVTRSTCAGVRRQWSLD